MFAIFIVNKANATVHTLNNNNPSPGQHSAWLFAQNACAMGDTIYVSGSPLSYGDITISVYNLTIIGTGHNPQKQNPLVSQIGWISSAVGKITLEGLKCKRIISTSGFIGVQDFHVNNCYIDEGMSIGNGSFDCYCYLKNNIIGYTPLSYQSQFNSLTVVAQYPNALKGEISNNIFLGNIDFYINGTYFLVDECNMFNNIFFGHGNGDSLFQDLTRYNNSIFSNNIIVNYSHSNLYYIPGTGESSVLCRNNLLYQSPISLPNETSTLSANPQFVNYPCTYLNCPFSYSYDLHLQTGSSGIGAGTNGTDIGVYGGPYGSSFTTYGEPPIPQVKEMTIPATVVSGNSFNVNIISKVK